VRPHRAGRSGSEQVVKRLVRRGQHSYLPAGIGQCRRQIANDVADTADLAASQRTVLGREENDVLAGNA
jgi:hypothetical protein